MFERLTVLWMEETAREFVYRFKCECHTAGVSFVLVDMDISWKRVKFDDTQVIPGVRKNYCYKLSAMFRVDARF